MSIMSAIKVLRCSCFKNREMSPVPLCAASTFIGEAFVNLIAGEMRRDVKLTLKNTDFPKNHHFVLSCLNCETNI